MRKIDFFKEVTLLLFLFFSVHFVALAQNLTVTGTVKDNKGEPLPGVNIILDGTTTGTVTDIDGNYRIEVPSNGVLIFNFIGFEVQSVPVNGQSVVNVTMSPSDISLEEIVVVGYGT